MTCMETSNEARGTPSWCGFPPPVVAGIVTWFRVLWELCFFPI